MRRIVVGFGLLCGACLAAARPADLSDWDGCVIRGSQLSPSKAGERERGLMIERGGAEVLLVDTRWGAGGLISVEHTWGALTLELPPGLARGQRLELSPGSARVEYTQGHSIVNYRSQRVTGTVRVLEVDDDELELELDLRATKPDVDLATEGDIALRGVVDAERVAAQRDCP